MIKGIRRFGTHIKVGSKVQPFMKFMDFDPKIGPSSVEPSECETPSYDKQSEVLIKVEATAVNRADLLQSNGKYPPPAGASEILGLECTGYLVDPRTDIITDRKVMALLSGGGFADFARVHKDHVIDIPKGMTFGQAAAIPEQWITAYQLLFDVAKAKEGETALVLAAASGVGTSLIQLCKSAGLNSIAGCRTVSKINKCRELGAFDGIICAQPIYEDRVKLITDGKGVDIILDPVLGSFFKTNLGCLGRDARWVIYGAMGGTTLTDVNLLKLLNKRACILSSTLRNRTDEYKTKLISEMQAYCIPRFESGELIVVIDSTFNLSDASRALEYMAGNKNTGKIVLMNNL